MRSKAKYIGLNQRIPFEVLDAGINFYLTKGRIDKDYLRERIQEFTSGSNRANKATLYLLQILNRQQDILDHLKEYLRDVPYSSLQKDDKRALSLCLISLTYPIAYDLLVALAQGFKVQDQINKKFINEKLMAIYGSNRTVNIAIDALLPMIIELKTIKRDRMSIYSMCSNLEVRNKFISELVTYTDIKLSGSKSILIDDLNFRPWFSYFEVPPSRSLQNGVLIHKKDSSVGKGYLTIKI
ncbi:hypothetical protein KK062_03605 [Fulvivirgaceae bacterium PWU5]|uniref:Uncharacterized protein n=1 Tax=Dawidia cretensis TaxID=2782350 RepID=A0AAP2DVQ5_9BACT|nr:hypothetical protein [Dawidia cretensis]MBT1707289.1 hypothetical protein [Dawidia cretensis]